MLLTTCGSGMAWPDAGGGATLPQAASIPTMRASITQFGNRFMVLILLESFGALLLLLLIVWWTMFSGRKNGERADTTEDSTAPNEPR
jgi:hypothetical protein